MTSRNYLHRIGPPARRGPGKGVTKSRGLQSVRDVDRVFVASDIGRHRCGNNTGVEETADRWDIIVHRYVSVRVDVREQICVVKRTVPVQVKKRCGGWATGNKIYTIEPVLIEIRDDRVGTGKTDARIVQ